MSDWRIHGQEAYLSGATLYKVTFPDFWKASYGQKNGFYRRVRDYAASYVERTHRCEELLEGESVGRFWHNHCEFCWEKVHTDKSCVFYCTEDMYYWICEDCFNDFCEPFHWTVKSDWELLNKLSIEEP